MNRRAAVFLGSALVANIGTGALPWSPPRISFEQLIEQNDKEAMLVEALQSVGMISITGIPYFDEVKQDVFESLPGCLSSSGPEVLEIKFPDGTIRKTLAAHSTGGQEHSAIPVPNAQGCALFSESSDAFQKAVGLVTEGVFNILSKELNLGIETPVLSSYSDDSTFTFMDIFQRGDHLDHFHCYYKDDSSFYDVKNALGEEETIEWHTDQGLALVFAPGSVGGEPTDGFYVRLADGAEKMVEFDQEDDLVILLGDGVNQYLNRVLDSEKMLRALPHALRMPNLEGPRVWYGRMMLPPPTALHPTHPFSFGEIRQQMLEEETLSIGCSHNMIARELEDVTCVDGYFCWHRCMNYTDYEVSPEICAEEGLDLACVNEEGMLWTGNHDASAAIRCVDLATARNITDLGLNGTDTDHGGDHDDDNEGDDDAVEESSGVKKHISGALVTILTVTYGAWTMLVF